MTTKIPWEKFPKKNPERISFKTLCKKARKFKKKALEKSSGKIVLLISPNDKN